jgi:tRNA-Thr(GGU) m(6)t(6)A37 methyltransferase TsaA
MKQPDVAFTSVTTRRSIPMKPIGFVKTDFAGEKLRDRPIEEIEADIEILDEYADGLEGIDGFSHLLVFFYLHKIPPENRKRLKIKPRTVTKYGLNLEEIPQVGVFCLDAPNRPNPIGLSAVRLLWRKGRLLHVKGIDALNETPVLDIKPYSPARRIEKFELPEWYKTIIAKARANGHDITDF